MTVPNTPSLPGEISVATAPTSTTAQHHRAHSACSTASTSTTSSAPGLTRTTSPPPPSVETLTDLLHEQLGMKRKLVPTHYECIPLSILEHTHGDKNRGERVVCSPRRRGLGNSGAAGPGIVGAKAGMGARITTAKASSRQGERSTGAGMATESDKEEEGEDEDEDSDDDLIVVI